MKLPNRFDIVTASFKEPITKIEKNVVGYVVDVRDEPTKSNSVNPNDGMPSYTPKIYTFRFLNEGLKEISEKGLEAFIKDCKNWDCIPSERSEVSDKPKYSIG